MGIEWKDIKQELGIVKTAPYILCFVLGGLLVWAVDARMLSNYQAEIALFHAKEAQDRNEIDILQSKLKLAVQVGDSENEEVRETLNICKKLWPDMNRLNDENILAAEREMAARGCEYKDQKGCQIPGVFKLTEWCLDVDAGIRAYQSMRPIGVE